MHYQSTDLPICWHICSAILGQQYQQYSFGQTNETSSSTEQTFASGFDTFVSSEPTGYGMYEERESNVFAPGENILAIRRACSLQLRKYDW
ncbi:hypothetical protein BH18THE2_BH18THE2_26690 [soil metagenome]